MNSLKLGGKNLNIENWSVYHPNGKHMFTCGEKKAKWYLDKDLAVVDENYKITLTFDPKGNGFEDNELFGRSIRVAKCVVGGSTENLQRHHIVPYCYRTYFPDEFKSKNHHDVVLINDEKHIEYEVHATEFKNEIAKKYNIKTIAELNSEYTKKLRDYSNEYAIPMSLIHSLFKSYGKISEEKLTYKLHEISKHTNIPFNVLCTYNYLQFYKIFLYLKEKYELEQENFRNKNRMYYDHGYHLSLKLNTDKKIMEFVKLWRKHFIDTMKPEFMPIGWSVDFRIKTKL